MRRSRGDRPTGDPRFCSSQQDTVATSCDPPLVSGRWRVGLRRAIASRRDIPADVKDQSYHPLHNSFQGNARKVYPIPPPLSSGKCGFWKFAGILIPRKLRKQTCFRAFINSRWDCGRDRSSDVRVCASPRWRLSMRCGRGAITLASVAASCDPPASRDKRDRCGGSRTPRPTAFCCWFCARYVTYRNICRG